MSHSTNAVGLPSDHSRAERGNVLFQEALHAVYVQRDRVFVWLMLVQWIVALGMAFVVSPRTWTGRAHAIHIHVYYAVLLGAALMAPTLVLVRVRPGSALTRHVIAFSQMMWSALLIHFSGGRIETHFHVFVSLAFIAFYRDWKLLITATLAVSADHLLRGMLWPESVYGIANPEWWRFLEHATWVLFEDVVLVMGILQNRQEMETLAFRQADLEFLNRQVEHKVVEQRDQLLELHATQQQLVQASRKTGMADVATAVLHNVGNVLNSVNVSASMIADSLQRSKLDAVPRTAALLKSHAGDIGLFLTQDEKGRRVPEYLARVGEALVAERAEMLGEVKSLQKNIDHIKIIVSMQQTHAKSSGGVMETLSLEELVDDALKFMAVSWEKHGIEIIRDFQGPLVATIDRHKVFQIVLNLLSNAKHALEERPDGARRITVRLASDGADRVSLVVQDTGCGVAPENLTKIFSHGFTTKRDGHGFGLHSGALAASELGGSLTVVSEGVGCGATFRLEIPRGPVAEPMSRAA